MIALRNILPPDKLKPILEKISKVQFQDGKVTAGALAKQIKNNLQIPASSTEGREAGAMITTALAATTAFSQATRPKSISSAMFSRYDAGMSYGEHLDNPLMVVEKTIFRADVSVTVFLSNPADYDGGELVINTDGAIQAVKLNAGDAIIYPSTYLHHVNPITRGSRLAAVLWVQSMIRDAAQRQILFELVSATQKLDPSNQGKAEMHVLKKCYNNLLRMWADV